MNMSRMLVLIGGLTLVIGARLPWMSVPLLFGVEGAPYEAIEIGWEDNGIITGAIGFILILGTVFTGETAEKRYSFAGAVLAALAVMVVIGCFLRVLEIDPEAGFLAEVPFAAFLIALSRGRLRPFWRTGTVAIPAHPYWDSYSSNPAKSANHGMDRR
jgi:hypothetical protein